jgi:hypothetical protein
VNDPARAQVTNLLVGVTQFPHQALSVLTGECTMSEAPHRSGEAHDSAMTQVFTETRAVDLDYHPIRGRLRMLLEKTSDIAVGSDTGNSGSNEKLFPMIGRPRSKNFCDRLSQLLLVFYPSY